MLTSVRNLVDFGGRKMTIGNHRMVKEGNLRKFYYFNHLVCLVDDNLKKFKLDDCGYSGYPSTTRTLNDYRKYF